MLRLGKVAYRLFARSTGVATENCNHSHRDKARRVLVRPIIDASAAFAVMFALALSLGIAPSSASPNAPAPETFQSSFSSTAVKALAEKDVQPIVEIALTTSSDSPNAVFHRTSSEAAWALLLLSLSVVAALNLAVVRHMRQAYTPARRRPSNSAQHLSARE